MIGLRKMPGDWEEAVCMREREEAEEDRFRRLDAAIRGNIRKKDEQKEKKLWKKKKPSQA